MTATDAVDRTRTLLVALGAVAVLALLWFVVVGPLFGGDEEPFVITPPSPRPTAPPAEELLPGDDVDEPFPDSIEVFTARDPFQQLVGPAAGSSVVIAPIGTPGSGGTTSGGTTNGGSTNGGTTNGGATNGGTTNGGTTNGGTTDGGTTNGSQAQVGGTTVRLVDIYVVDGSPRALVQVNDRAHRVAEGEEFADRFRLLDISGECATFLFGDNRFVLCEGEQIRK